MKDKGAFDPIPFFLFFLACFSCVSALSQDHPLEQQLIGNVQVVGEEKFYTLEDRLAYQEVAGFVLGLIEDGILSFKKGYGIANQDSQLINPEAIFHVGSISKPFVATTLLKMQEEGLIDIDQPANKYLEKWQLPAWPDSATTPITVRELMNHTAGLNVFNAKGIDRNTSPPSLPALFEGNEYAPTLELSLAQRGTYVYSNYGYGILQLIIEELNGTSLDEAVRHYVFKPLDLSASSFKSPSASEVPSKMVCGFAYSGKQMPQCWNRPLIPGSGGLTSSLSDLVVFLQDLANAINNRPSKVFTKEIGEQILASTGYSLGFEVEGAGQQLSITHTGRVPGFFTYMRIYPMQGKGIFMLTNSDNGGGLFKEVLRAATKHYGWDILKPKTITAFPLPTSTLRSYEGDYELTLEGKTYTAEIKLVANTLIYKMKEDDEAYPLCPISETGFIDIIDGDAFEFIQEEGATTSFLYDEYRFERVE